MEPHYLLGPQEVLTIFFIMLGPMKMLAPFAKATKEMTSKEIWILASKSACYASLVVALGGVVGRHMLFSWNISNPILMLAGAIIFFITALKMIFRFNDNGHADEEPLTTFKVVFKMIVTPYGMAAVISLAATSESFERALMIFGKLMFVMLLNFLAMALVRQIMGKVGMIVMSFLGAFLGTLQASLALAMINTAVRMLLAGK